MRLSEVRSSRYGNSATYNVCLVLLLLGPVQVADLVPGGNDGRVGLEVADGEYRFW